MLSQQIGRFTDLVQIGKGGAGDVYLARDPGREEKVALKVVWLKADPELSANEERGAELQRQVAAVVPEIAQVHSIEKSGGYLLIAMEYVEGEDLASILPRGALPERRAAQLAAQLLSILERAHDHLESRHGRLFVHGDLKPSNVRIELSGAAESDADSVDPERRVVAGPSERVRLLDFGIAKTASLTRKKTHRAFATYAYASPEYLREFRAGETDDLWSVAVMLFQMVSGALPFDGRDEREQQLRILTNDRSPLPPSTSTALRGILERALDPNSQNRFDSARSFRLAIESSLAQFTDRVVALPSVGPAGVDESTRRTSDSGEATRRTEEEVRATVERWDEATRRTTSPHDGTPLPPLPPTSKARQASGAESPPANPAEETGTSFRPSAPTAEELFPNRPGSASRPLGGLPPPGLAIDSRLDSSAAPPSPTFRPPGDWRVGLPRRRWMVAMVLVLGAYLMSSETYAWLTGNNITHQLSADQADLPGLFKSYRRAQFWSPFGFGLQDDVDQLVERAAQEAGSVLRRYSDARPPRRDEWANCVRLLDEVFEARAGHPGREAMRLVCRGHELRLEADSLRRSQEWEASEPLLDEAIASFERAARLAPEDVDAFVGLARVYAYYRVDVESLEWAIAEAEKRGHRAGDREQAQLADATARRARRPWSGPRSSGSRKMTTV